MSTETEISSNSSEAKANESLPGSDTKTQQANSMRQSPLDITVILPNGKKLLIMSVSPSEPTSFIKQNLQEFQESALYSNYFFETVDNRAVSDYVEIANYAPTSEDICTMTIHLVPAHYDVRKSRQQLKRVRDIISYPPTITGVSIEKDDVTEANTESTEAADLVTVQKHDASAGAELESALRSEDDAVVDEVLLLQKAVIDEKFILNEKVTILETEKECEESSSESKEEHAVKRANKLQLIEEVVSSQIELDSDASEKKIVSDSDSANTASSEVKENSPVEEEIMETKIAVEVKPFAPEDDGIKVTAIDDDIAATETLKTPVIKRKLPSEEEIFAPVCLGSFFREVLLRVASAEEPPSKVSKMGSEAEGTAARVKEPSECVKSVSASGWNPPPMSRASQGDLLYIEAVTGTDINWTVVHTV
jgi:Mitochondrial function, CLU-N-term